jgi:hypothetical protein
MPPSITSRSAYRTNALATVEAAEPSELVEVLVVWGGDDLQMASYLQPGERFSLSSRTGDRLSFVHPDHAGAARPLVTHDGVRSVFHHPTLGDRPLPPGEALALAVGAFTFRVRRVPRSERLPGPRRDRFLGVALPLALACTALVGTTARRVSPWVTVDDEDAARHYVVCLLRRNSARAYPPSTPTPDGAPMGGDGPAGLGRRRGRRRARGATEGASLARGAAERSGGRPRRRAARHGRQRHRRGAASRHLRRARSGGVPADGAADAGHARRHAGDGQPLRPHGGRRPGLRGPGAAWDGLGGRRARGRRRGPRAHPDARPRGRRRHRAGTRRGRGLWMRRRGTARGARPPARWASEAPTGRRCAASRWRTGRAEPAARLRAERGSSARRRSVGW